MWSGPEWGGPVLVSCCGCCPCCPPSPPPTTVAPPLPQVGSTPSLSVFGDRSSPACGALAVLPLGPCTFEERASAFRPVRLHRSRASDASRPRLLRRSPSTGSTAVWLWGVVGLRTVPHTTSGVPGPGHPPHCPA